MAIFKKGHRFIVTFFSMLIAFFLGIFGKTPIPSAQENQDDQDRVGMSSPHLAVTSSQNYSRTSDKEFLISLEKDMLTPPENNFIISPFTSDYPIRKSLKTFLKGDVKIPSTNVIKQADEDYEQKYIQYQFLSDILQLNIIQTNQLDLLIKNQHKMQKEIDLLKQELQNNK